MAYETSRPRVFRARKTEKPDPTERRTSHIWRRPEQTVGAIPAGRTFCEQKYECGNCRYVGDDYDRGLNTKHKAGLAKLREIPELHQAKVTEPKVSPLQAGYQSLFQLAVRPGRRDRFAIGQFKAGTHHLVETDSCPLNVHALKRLIPKLREFLGESSLTPYDENSNTGDVRYIAARAAHMTGEIMLTFVVTRDCKRELKEIVRQLRLGFNKINSAHMNINTENGDAVFGAETIKIAGNEILRERMCELDYDVSPTAFFQANPWQAERLYRRIEQIAGPAAAGEVAWDFYCGGGHMSLLLGRLGYKVLGIEENVAGVRNANTNARKNNLNESCHFMAGRVEDVLQNAPNWAKAPKFIVVNPSQDGLADNVRTELVMTALRSGARIIYVSCEVNTLTRDIGDFVRAGLKVRQVESFDMFPQTANMEWLTVITP